MASEVYLYVNFDQIESFYNAAEEGKLIAAEQIAEVGLSTHRGSVSLSASVSNSAQKIQISNMLKHRFAKP